VEDAIQVALKARLDYQNAMGRVDDAQRRVRLAIDNLKPQMDLVAGVSLSSDPNKTSGFAYPELQRYHWNAGLDLDIPLDRLEKRNIYRSSLINEAQAERAVMQLGDEIGLEVRDNWRLLEQARRTYEISEAGVKLAERRVEEQNLLAELGRARALDQVDAQNSLLSSRNQRTQALVGHTIARLRFWNSMGILYVKDNGQWKEIPDAVN
jgi:outer membrane protein TolC